MAPLGLAFAFLTRLPIPTALDLAAVPWGRAVPWFPAVGAVVGVLVLATALLPLDPPLAAALGLGVWVVVTGGLHLDGLADSVDAWLGGGGDRERTLALMKDPHSGALAVVALVVVLVVKFAALQSLVAAGAQVAAVAAAVLGRTALVAALLTTPYVRRGGLGQAFVETLDRPGGALAAGLSVLGVLALGWPGIAALGAVAAALGVGWLWRREVMARLGGTTGDTLGALCEGVETAVLVAWVALAGSGP
ncbi:MAG: adenosylcobinamide-GDP ribazoletransferase [Candidatus Competibacterales bacterium]